MALVPAAVALQADPLTQWRKSRNKDDLAHYGSQQLRRQYAQHEMPKRSRDTCKWLRKPVQRLLEARAAAAAAAAGDCPALQLLSLGCGPGSDLLGALRCLADVRHLRLAVECTGVDLHQWDWSTFWLHRTAVATRMSGSAFKILSTKLQQGDMRTFVADSLARGAKFDLITMSYANAKETLAPNMVHQLPQLLRAGGSIVIVDNNSSKLVGLCSRNRNYRVVHRKCKKIVIVCEK